jgi:hypothetical protein
MEIQISISIPLLLKTKNNEKTTEQATIPEVT